MKIHEYQARQILKNFDVPVPVAEVASSPEEARKIAEEIGGKVWAVKSQIHAGGRGKGGGVKLARSLEDVSNLSRLMIGSRLVTKQTGPAGAPVSKVLVQQGSPIVQEFYVGFLIDRKLQRPVLIASAEGGMEIEKVAAQFPEKIIKTGTFLSAVTISGLISSREQSIETKVLHNFLRTSAQSPVMRKTKKSIRLM